MRLRHISIGKWLRKLHCFKHVTRSSLKTLWLDWKLKFTCLGTQLSKRYGRDRMVNFGANGRDQWHSTPGRHRTGDVLHFTWQGRDLNEGEENDRARYVGNNWNATHLARGHNVFSITGPGAFFGEIALLLRSRRTAAYVMLLLLFCTVSPLVVS